MPYTGEYSQFKERIVFVLGTGRSGTHLLGHVLASFPDIQVNMEKPPIFNMVTKMALHPDYRQRSFPELVSLYQKEAHLALPRLLVDKSHPCIWFAKDLAAIFPQSLFLGIQRDVYGTVASMLKHEMVLSWHQRWREFPVPNEFLGITKKIAGHYESLSMPKRCALRWLSHSRQMRNLVAVLGSRIHVIDYESLVCNPHDEVGILSRFLNLPEPDHLPEMNRQSLHRWQMDLSDAACTDIEHVTGIRRHNTT